MYANTKMYTFHGHLRMLVVLNRGTQECASDGVGQSQKPYVYYDSESSYFLFAFDNKSEYEDSLS